MTSDQQSFPRKQVWDAARSAVGHRYGVDLSDEYPGGITLRIFPLKPVGEELEVDIYWSQKGEVSKFTVDVTHIIRSETHHATDHDLDVSLIGHVINDVITSVYGPLN